MSLNTNSQENKVKKKDEELLLQQQQQQTVSPPKRKISISETLFGGVFGSGSGNYNNNNNNSNINNNNNNNSNSSASSSTSNSFTSSSILNIFTGKSPSLSSTKPPIMAPSTSTSVSASKGNNSSGGSGSKAKQVVVGFDVSTTPIITGIGNDGDGGNSSSMSSVNASPIPSPSLLSSKNDDSNYNNINIRKRSYTIDTGALNHGHELNSTSSPPLPTMPNMSHNSFDSISLVAGDTSNRTSPYPSSSVGTTPQLIAISPSLFSPIKKQTLVQGYMDEYYEIDKGPKTIELARDLELVWKNVILPKQQQVARNELKFIIRRGIPDDKRVQVWKLIMGYEEFKHTLEFQAVRSTLQGDTIPKKFRNIPSFGGVVSPSDHYLTEDGIQLVKRILSITAMNFPEIEYCPVIPDIVHILLVFMSELDTYTMLNLFIKQSKDNFYRYLNTSNRECTIFVLTFDSLVEKHIPKLYKHMISLGIQSCKEFCEEWFSRLFVSTLPFHTVLRVFDVFLSEGYKVLYRVGLGLLNIHKRYLIKNANTADAFISTLKNLNSQMCDTTLLMKKSFGIHLKREDLVSIDTQHTHKLRNVAEPDLPVYYRPKVSQPSAILDDEHYEMIWAWLPNKYGICDPKLMYSTEENGYNLGTMFQRLGDEYPVLVIIKSDLNHIFGFFIDDPITPSSSYFGSASTFVFTIKPDIAIYKATLKNELFYKASNNQLTVGGSEKGEYSISLDKDLNGTTCACETFDNPCLNVTKDTFSSLVLEAYVLR